ncbi:(Fe-S)-binding protein [Rhodococcus sp. D2-41]|uniref:(Fe-S)-binding protein n=1 Tax=Speluncibacter jeojiensis TaxID=2710754 RepID=UPI00240F2536|nr:(Fe-S)-binding protein [Rhodococcus sp. D2-41]MDG3010192.1 (Fe-S)-binding protein [Rhodococcus sp. D2-41]
MNATTITLGTIGVLISLVCWAVFFSGVWRIIASIRLGQRDGTRNGPFVPRLSQMIVEFLGHTKMVKFRTVGWAHWLVMIGFILGSLLWFEAYGETFDPHFHWPLFGATHVWLFIAELLGWGTVIGILVLMVIRQLNHPRVPGRMSRFSGSVFSAAYFVEWVVLIEGLGMIMVKAGKISSGVEEPPIWTSFGTHFVAKALPASLLMVSIFALIKLLSGMIWLFMVGRKVTWGVAWHRLSAFFNIYFKRELGSKRALGAAKPMMSGGKVLEMEDADPDVDAFGAGKIEDFSWKGWLDFTTCTECGRCQSQCPAWNTGKPLSPKLLIMSLRDHGFAKAPYLLAGGKTDMAGDEVGLVGADGKPDEAALAKIPAAARAEAGRKMVGESTEMVDGGELAPVIDYETLWSCTSCGACVEQCPVDIEHVDHIIDMRRYQVLIESEFPSELAGLFKNLENKGNPWGQNSKDRINWVNEVEFEVPVYGRDADSFDGYEYLFWVGCAGAYEDRAKKTTKAVAELLNVAAVDYLVLGEGETCTGDSARRAGNEFLFQQLAMQNIETFNDLFDGVPQERRKIVVTCAHCFNALSNEYPQVGGHYEVVHHTQLLNKLVRDKRLIPVAPVEGSEQITYHDPCFLGRHNQVYDAPRELIGASAATLTEMPRHGERSLCCGAGGARMWMEENIGKRINIERVDEALDTLGSGATTQKIATGCPFCRVMLTDGVTARQESGQGEGVEVVDVAQLILDGVRRGGAVPTKELKKQPAKPAAEPAAAAATAVVETAPAATPAEEAPKAAAPKPAVKGLGMAGAAKAPGGAKAPGKGLGMAGGAKAPGAKGLGLAGGAKAPGAKKAAPAAQAPAEAPATEAPAAETPAKPAGLSVKAKGLGMAGGAKAPGAKKPGAPKTAAPAAEPAPEATPATEAPAAEAPAKPAGLSVKAKGLGMAGGAKAPGARRSAPAAPKSEPAPEAPAAETPAAEAPEAPTTATPQADDKPALSVKPKGLGMRGGAKPPGKR